MKKLFFILLLLPAIVGAQVHFGLGAGYDVSKSKPLANINIGYTASNNIMIEAVMQPAITRAVNSDHYFGGKIGYNIHNLVPAVGYYYNYKNADDKAMNKWIGVGYSLKYILPVNDNGGLYAEALYLN